MRRLPLVVAALLAVGVIGCDAYGDVLEALPDAATLIQRQPPMRGNAAVVRASGEPGQRTGDASFRPIAAQRGLMLITLLSEVTRGPGQEKFDGAVSISLVVSDSLGAELRRTGRPRELPATLYYLATDGGIRSSYEEPLRVVVRQTDSVRIEASFAGFVRDPPPEHFCLPVFCPRRRLQYIEGRFHAVRRAPANGRRVVVSAQGGVAEWLMAAVLKTADPQGFVGSNPTPSAAQARHTAPVHGGRRHPPGTRRTPGPVARSVRVPPATRTARGERLSATATAEPSGWTRR